MDGETITVDFEGWNVRPRSANLLDANERAEASVSD